MRWLWSLVLCAGLAAGGETFVVSAGVESYEDTGISSLKYAVADARAVAATFRASGVPRGNVTVLTSDQKAAVARPSRIRVIAALQSVRDRAGEGDRLVFFFAGHGVEQAGEQYLLTSDTRRDLLAETALPMGLMSKALRGIRASEVLFLIDACRNDPQPGRADNDARMTDGLARGLRPRVEAASTGPKLVASLLGCDVGERSWEMPEEGHGAFTWYLLRGLRGAAASGGLVRLKALAKYVQAQVADWAIRAERHQTPRLINPQDLDMELLRPPAEPVVSISFRNTELGAAIDEIATEYGVQIVLGKGVDGTVPLNGRLELQPLSTALRVLLMAHDLTVTRDGEIYVIQSRAGAPANPVQTERPKETPAQPETAQPPRLLPQVAHASLVRGLAFTQEDRWLVTAGEDQQVTAWDAATGELVGLAHGHAGPIYGLALSSAAERLVTTTFGDLIAWDSSSLTQDFTIPTGGYSVAVSPDGRQAALGAMAGVRFADLRSREVSNVAAGHRPNVRAEAIAYSPDGRRVVSGGDDGSLTVWDPRSRQPLLKLQAHTAPVTGVGFSPDGSQFVSAAREPTLRIWDTATGNPVSSLNGQTHQLSVAWSADGRWIASVNTHDKTFVWSTDDPEPRAVFHYDGQGAGAIALARNHPWVATGYSHAAVIWDIEKNEQIAVLGGRTDLMVGVTFAAAERLLFGRSWSAVTAWGLDTADVRWHVGEPRLPVGGMACNRAGDLLAMISGKQASIRVAATGEELTVIDLPRPLRYPEIAFGPTSERLYLRGYRESDWFVHDPRSGQPLPTISTGTPPVGAAALTASGRELVVSDSTGLTARDAVSGKTERVLLPEAKGCQPLVVTHDDTRVAVVQWKDVHVVALAGTGKPMLLRGHQQIVSALAASPTQPVLASGARDGIVALWNLATGKPIHVLKDVQAIITALDFSADGRLLAASSADGRLTLWRVADGKHLATLYSLDYGENWLITTPEGYYTGSEDGEQVVRWVADSKVLPASAFSQRYRNAELVKAALRGEDIP